LAFALDLETKLAQLTSVYERLLSLELKNYIKISIPNNQETKNDPCQVRQFSEAITFCLWE